MTTVDGLRVGLFSLGLKACWPQFQELKERLLSCNGQIADHLAYAISRPFGSAIQLRGVAIAVVDFK